MTEIQSTNHKSDSPKQIALPTPMLLAVSSLVSFLILGAAAYFSAPKAVWIGLILGIILAVANLAALTRIIGGLLGAEPGQKGFFGVLLALKLLFLGGGIAIGLWVFSADLVALVSGYMAVTLALLTVAGRQKQAL